MPPAPRPPLPAAKRALFGALLTGALVLGLELACRLVPVPPRAPLVRGGVALPDGAVADPVLGWAYAPGTDLREPPRELAACPQLVLPVDPDDRINSLGLRGPEPTPPAPGELRALVLGDSSAFGAGVQRPATFAAVAEAELRAEGRPATLLNAAVPGWSSFQALIRLRQLLERRPPLGLTHLVAYVMNSDLMTPMTAWPDDRWFPMARRLPLMGPLQGAALVRVGGHLLRPLLPAPSGPARERVSVTSYRANLNQLADIAEEARLTLIFMMPPHLPDALRPPAEAPGTEQRTRLRAAMREVGHARGAPVIDGPGLIFGSGAADRAALGCSPKAAQGCLEQARARGVDVCGALFLDDLHPSPAGHALLGAALAQALRAPPAAPGAG
jgi:lysophospholipase L1-like esterase